MDEKSVCAKSIAPFDFSRHSTVGCGGLARIAYFPQTIEECKAQIRALSAQGAPYYVLGNLSNVLPPDEGTDRAIVSTKKLTDIQIGDYVFVQAGVTSGRLLAVCKKEGLTGAEFLYGIPCTIGGALYMNGGAGGRYIAEIVESVLVLRNGEELLLPVQACGYGYKQSAFMQNGDCILGGYFRLARDSIENIESCTAYYRNRRAHLPTGRSMGCVFKNPEGGFAGDLIERSGLKGFRIGGAKISEEHANFIINDRQATAKDIRALIAIVKNAVYAQYGVRLDEEIRYL